MKTVRLAYSVAMTAAWIVLAVMCGRFHLGVFPILLASLVAMIHATAGLEAFFSNKKDVLLSESFDRSKGIDPWL